MLESIEVQLPLCGGGRIVEAAYQARPNRFLIEAALADGRLVQAHLADRGRLKELLLPGARVLLAEKSGATRKTAFQVAGVYSNGTLVSLDTHLPNRLIEQALLSGALPQFDGYERVRREAPHPGGAQHRSRFDFELSGPAGRCIIEVKSANLVIDGVAHFPDAPTDRGRRHILELLELKRSGIRAALIFCAQRDDARAIAANRETDPAFAAALDEVAAAGLEIYGYLCPLTPRGIRLGAQLPVLFGQPSPADACRQP